jgi:hypothetical protein
MQTDSESDNLDAAPNISEGASASRSSSSGSSSGSSPDRKKPALRSYIETFDESTMRETATLMSKEGASLLDRQTKALWGDVKELQAEMQKV